MEHPLTTQDLVGHAATVLYQLSREADEGRLAHGILLAGPKGTGKATLAYHLARMLLGEGDEVYNRIIAGSHADLLVVEPRYDEKKEEFAREITVEQTREISSFLSLTAGEGTWRVVIVDGADAMNVQAANAILKILEEPPQHAVLILIAHNEGKLLSTIRSRCRMFKMAPLSKDDFLTIARASLPEASREDIFRLGDITDYSPGLAVALHAQGALELYDQIEAIFDAFPNIPHERVLALADAVGGGKQHQNWTVFSRLTLHFLAKRAKLERSGFWAEKWQAASENFSLCEARHLDYKSVVIGFFHTLNTQTMAA